LAQASVNGPFPLIFTPHIFFMCLTNFIERIQRQVLVKPTTGLLLDSPLTLSFIGRFLLMCLVAFHVFSLSAYCYSAHSTDNLDENKKAQKEIPTFNTAI
jgi:hypothetical protein